MAEFMTWTAHQLTAALATRQVSAAEVMQATLDQIAAENPSVNAIVSLRDGDALLAEARAADQQGPHGPLHGIPIAVKDLANVAGLPTSQGSPLFAGSVAAQSDMMVQRMQDAGAIVIGKTNTPEFGLGSHTFNPVAGATQNALMPGTSAGGSSGGAAVALARHMVCLADGSDMMGSLRNPAGWNGVYGMRPTWGRVPSEPLGDMFMHQLSTGGPMARCPRDVALLLDVQSGPDPRQPLGLPNDAFAGRIRADVKGRRIAWLADWGGAYPMEDGVQQAAEAAVGRFAQMGCTVEAVKPPFAADAIWEAWITLRSFAVAASLGPIYDQPELRDQLKPEAIWEVAQGRALTGQQIQRASALRSDWYRAAGALFETYDAFVLPTAQCWPFPIDWHWPKHIGGVAMDTYHRWMEIVVPVSLIGLPCLAVPIDGPRPMGLQIAGPRGADLSVLQLGQAWEEARA
ncbi:amidase [Loktanella sp. Alg231-35]|uniref:amidase n=1 Tax=Loktanella sp. Alg231-35 TaxID=1922220 RepID=UPI001EEB70C9|nr:amidase [Loktanella sp. Alg231-35]